MAQYIDKYSGKLWINEAKNGSTDPDFKGQMTLVSDIAKVTTIGSDGRKSIDYSAIPADSKMTVSLWKNPGKDGGPATLNLKVATKTGGDEDKDDFPF